MPPKRNGADCGEAWIANGEIRHEAYRRELRKLSTKPERLLWWELRNRSLDGFKFRRQHSIGPWIADFACLHPKLIVELDGEYHDYTVEHDQQRQSWLEKEGWTVLRFQNDDVYEDIDAVVEAIRHRLRDLINSLR